ncbi:hypothetical protein EME01_60470 [Sinorhizobium meliloti]|nr:hypothetical protein EME01_60470 [Sinorhizobium meliloti]
MRTRDLRIPHAALYRSFSRKRHGGHALADGLSHERQGAARLRFHQPSLNAQLATTAAKEWTGLVAYYLLGRTQTLLPR